MKLTPIGFFDDAVLLQIDDKILVLIQPIDKQRATYYLTRRLTILETVFKCLK